MQRTFKIEDNAATETLSSGGAEIEINFADVPASLIPHLFMEGVREAVRDARSAAVATAYFEANGDKGTVESRKTWAEENEDAITAVGERLMTEKWEQIKSGDLSTVRASALSPHDALRADTIRAASVAKKGGAWLHDAPEAVHDALAADRVSSAAIVAGLADASESFRERLDREVNKRAATMAKRAREAAIRANEMAKIAGLSIE